VPATARRRLRFTFPPALIQEPIIYRLVKDFHIVVNIRRAEGRADPGWVVLELDGEEERLERGIAWLKAQGVRVDPSERDVMSP
jgi:hypothetical protein